MTSSSILSCAGLVKSFGAVEVLRGIDLSVDRGEFVALLGPSGSGKSTLLSLLAGLDRPTAGEVRLAGERIDGYSESDLSRLRREKIGFVFQSFHLVPSLPLIENVGLPEAFRTGRFDAGRAGSLLERVGLSHRAGHLPSQLSGGEKQRAAIARALINDPAVVFADEPTGNLDSVTGAKVMDLLLEHTRGAGRTLLLVTHDAVLADRADRRIHLVDGVLAP